MIRQLTMLAVLIVSARVILQNRSEVDVVKANEPNVAQRLIAGAGRIEPRSEEIQVGADVVGRLQEVLVEESQIVRKGEVIAIIANEDYRARVDMADALIRSRRATIDRLRNGSRPEQRLQSQAELQEAEAVLQNARIDRDRHSNLFQQALISRMEFDAAEQRYQVAVAKANAQRQASSLVQNETRVEDLAQAQAELEQAVAYLAEAKSLLAKTYIVSPIDGTVLRKKMKAGESITTLSNQPVVTVGDCTRFRVRMDVDEIDVGRIRVGQQAWIRAEAFGDRKFAAKVVRIGRMLGRKNVRTDEPGEKIDQKVLETILELDASVTLPVGLRVDAYILPDATS